ncbi:MAG: hypothetical protein IPH51_10130 [Rubrivivax sp.]|nr:hypothetical protein [Rubrivivax sp.]
MVSTEHFNPLIAAIAACALLGGCGMSNQTLKVEYPYLAVVQDDADETVTIARTTADGVVATEYNLRNTLTVRAPAGWYYLDGKDSAGGRYFATRGWPIVTLTYSGLTLLGSAKPETVNGGIYVDAQGLVSVYWFWEADRYSPVRLRAPGLAVSISTEIDQDRRRARLEREERARLAKATQLEADRLAKAKQLEAEEARLKAEQHKRTLQAALALAQSRDRVQCAGAQCDRAFAQAQAYLLKQTDMRIQVATSTLIETYNPTSDGRLSMRLLRVPTAGDRWKSCSALSVAMNNKTTP